MCVRTCVCVCVRVCVCVKFFNSPSSLTQQRQRAMCCSVEQQEHIPFRGGTGLVRGRCRKVPFQSVSKAATLRLCVPLCLWWHNAQIVSFQYSMIPFPTLSSFTLNTHSCLNTSLIPEPYMQCSPLMWSRHKTRIQACEMVGEEGYLLRNWARRITFHFDWMPLNAPASHDWSIQSKHWQSYFVSSNS